MRTRLQTSALVVLAWLVAAPAWAQREVDAERVYLGSAACILRTGSGSPEGAVVGKPCDTYFQVDGLTIWRKAPSSGTDNSGWEAVGGVGGSGTTGTLPKWTGSTTLGDSILGESSGTVTVGGTLAVSNVGSHLVPVTGDTYDLGSASNLWRSSYISTMNALVFAETTQTLFGGYSTIGIDAGSFAADVASGASTIDFGKTMTPGHWVLVRAHDTSGTIRAEFFLVGSNVSGTTYNVTRDLAAAHSPDPAWAAGTPFLVRGAEGAGRIDLVAVDGKPRIVWTQQGSAFNTEEPRIVIGNLNTYYGYVADLYGAGIGNPSAANIVVDVVNGIRIRHGTTNKITLSAAGDASFTGEISAATGAIGGFTISSTSLTAGSGSSAVGVLSSGAYAFHAGNTTPGLSPFRVTMAGELVSVSGEIGGWTLGSTSLTAGSGSTRVGLDSGGTNPAIYAGSATPGSAPFRVTNAGALTATNATITGAITATSGSFTGSITSTSGTIGGWTIGASSLTGGNATLASSGNLTLGTGNNVVRASADDGSYRLWVGHATAASAPFRVSTAGTVAMTDAYVTGEITGSIITGSEAYFGGSDQVTLDSDGITIDAGTGDANAIKWTDGSEIISRTDTDALFLSGPGVPQINIYDFATVVWGNSADGVIFTGSILAPWTTNTHSLGDSSNRWENLYADGDIRFAGLAGAGEVCADGAGFLLPCVTNSSSATARVLQLETRVAELEAALYRLSLREVR
jgi:hypothetical protein